MRRLLLLLALCALLLANGCSTSTPPAVAMPTSPVGMPTETDKLAIAPDVFERTFTRRDEPESKRTEETTEQSPLPEKSTDKVPAELLLPQGKRISLAVIAGPDGGSVYRIEKPRVTIGRASADLTLNDTEASRVHAAIEVRDVAILLRDLGSTNGTLVDGQRILDAVELQDKSEFQVGATVLMLIVTEDG